jgi:hypothetical protein
MFTFLFCYLTGDKLIIIERIIKLLQPIHLNLRLIEGTWQLITRSTSISESPFSILATVR